MAKPPQSTPSTNDTLLQRLFTIAFGALLGLSLLKLGNPVVMDTQLTMPTEAFEWALMAWPLGVGQVLFVLVGLMGILVARKRPAVPLWLVLAPLPWLAWQIVAATHSVDRLLSIPTLMHFCTNIGCFYLGLYCLSPIRELRWYWSGLLAGYGLVLLSGWQQHFGGLETSREFFFKEVYPRLTGEVSEAMLKRMSSNRIFATLFYPNTLAGAILLLTPVCIGALPACGRAGRVRRIGLMLMIALAGGCLLWSGSKAGWLLALGLAGVTLLRLEYSRTLKVGIIVVVMAGGLAGFAWKYAGYLQKGAQSAAARVDYWEAALNITTANPWTGTGPGTFGTSYAEVKRPQSEMARLTHNDYLQQASDSGIPGFLSFTGFILVLMIRLGRRVWNSHSTLQFWIWLGLLGVSLQSLVEFGWYIPAISWPMMALTGWLLGSPTNDLDNPKRQNLSSGRI